MDNEQRACVGRFYMEDRIAACKECEKCKRHLDFVYCGGPLFQYDLPSRCRNFTESTETN